MLIVREIFLTLIDYVMFSAEVLVNFFLRLSVIIINIFYPSGEPISRHRLRCSLFDVDYYAFTGRFLHLYVGWGGLASAREYSRQTKFR